MTESKMFVEPEEIFEFLQLIFPLAQAMGIYPWNMQDLVMKETYKPHGFVPIQPIRSAYDQGISNSQIDLPSFDDVLEKLAWIQAAEPGDEYRARMRDSIREYKELIPRED